MPVIDDCCCAGAGSAIDGVLLRAITNSLALLTGWSWLTFRPATKSIPLVRESSERKTEMTKRYVGGCIGHLSPVESRRCVGGCLGSAWLDNALTRAVGGCVGHVWASGRRQFVGGCLGCVSRDNHQPSRRLARVRRSDVAHVWQELTSAEEEAVA